jgi:N-acetyl-1-D-myo-inositol-2-amino-2-deoxy-alpha-D-glucopyranoside deacetylase
MSGDSTVNDRRLLLVHAHPDDESIGTGATMAKYVAEGAHVTLVTCTLGELGEIIPEELAHLAADQENRLGEYRIGELAAACEALGVTDHRFLGGPGRWRDSGMMGLPANNEPGSFWQADVDEAARELVAVITEVRPQVIVTYDENGFYGHPDHIQAHRVAWRAFQLAPWRAAKFYATADGADERLTTEIDGTRYLDAKIAAMRAHATQIAVATPFFALSNKVRRRIMGHEYYTLLAGERGPAAGPQGREDDLFAGLD